MHIPRHRGFRTSRLVPVSLLASALVAVLVNASGPASLAPAAESGPTTTAVGSTVYKDKYESAYDAYRRVSDSFGGRLGAARVFFPGLPAAWSKINANYGETPLIVSFKANPSAVLAGQYDAQLRTWFATAPTDRVTRWTYWHEPEDDWAGGSSGAADYRLAWQRIASIADSVGNGQLQATLILMCWTLEPNSNRDWRDYYAGPQAIDMLAFDCYNAGWRNATYRSPEGLLEHAAALSASTGIPWGIAELGSIVVSGDDGTGRARWLQEIIEYASSHDAQFVTYFNSKVNVDYRLHDAASASAWRSLTTEQFG